MSKKVEARDANFKKLITTVMSRRWLITLVVLVTFLILMHGIAISIQLGTEVSQEWKELLLLMLGAFIASYGKIIDYWFTESERDKVMVEKMSDELKIKPQNLEIEEKQFVLDTENAEVVN